MKIFCDVNGLRLVVDAEAPELVTAIMIHLTPFVTQAFAEVDYAISFERGQVDQPPSDVEVVHQCEVVPGVSSQLAADGERNWLVVPGSFSVTSDQSKRATRIRIGDDCDRSLLGLAGICAIEKALSASGQYLFHGAALALPGAPSRALLIFAPSGVGKTTTALALALGGFQLITDDAIVLQPSGYSGRGSAHAWGLPRPLKVHRRTSELLPAIAPLLQENLWDSAGEQPLRTAALDKIAPVAAPIPIPVAAVAVLGEHSDSGHRIAPLSKAHALGLIAQDNTGRTRRGVLSAQAERFAALGTLLAFTPTFELHVGAPLATFPDHVESALDKFKY
jgi:hypothetical protein